jgi:ribosomal protein S18 acetylase RimI-like enzyme
VVGYCDIDNRHEKLARGFPTPYLSDVIVSKDFRRRKIGQNMIQVRKS